MRLGPLPARLVSALLLVPFLSGCLLLGGCSSWTLAPGELERSGQSVRSQAQVMRLVASAALRDHPPTTVLQVLVDDAEQTLAEERRKIEGLQAPHRRKRVLLRLADRLGAQVGPLRAALDSGDHHGLRQVRRDVASIAAELESLGIS